MPFDYHAAYDALNPADHDYRFYTALAASLGAQRIVDLGCGTGTLALALAAQGLAVVGVDPDPDMIRVARSRDVGTRVDWRLGTAGVIGAEEADLAVLCGHVAQVFTDDGAWTTVLGHLHRALSPGGILAFESRAPAARAWDRWTRADTLRTVDTADGPVEFWHETATVALPLVAYDTFTRDLRTGAETSDRDTLAFRDERTLRSSVESAGFDVIDVLGDWDRTPPGPGAPELIVIAQRR